MLIDKKMEARPGIEPGCKDLQSSASPLRHRASTSGGGQLLGFRLAVNRVSAVAPLWARKWPRSLGGIARAKYIAAFSTSVLHE